MTPEDLLYAKTHEWVHLTDEDDRKVATVGLSDFAAEALTDLVYFDLPEVGTAVTAGEPFGEVESVKAVSDLYSPVTGEIVEVNTPLIDRPETLTEDPFGAGWIVKIAVGDESGLADLFDHATYRKQCEEEES